MEHRKSRYENEYPRDEWQKLEQFQLPSVRFYVKLKKGTTYKNIPNDFTVKTI